MDLKMVFKLWVGFNQQQYTNRHRLLVGQEKRQYSQDIPFLCQTDELLLGVAGVSEYTLSDSRNLRLITSKKPELHLFLPELHLLECLKYRSVTFMLSLFTILP
jgi:hypothetical protein